MEHRDLKLYIDAIWNLTKLWKVNVFFSGFPVEVPSTQTLCNLLLEKFGVFQKKVLELLSTAGWQCCTADFWNTEHYGFICFTAHFVSTYSFQIQQHFWCVYDILGNVLWLWNRCNRTAFCVLRHISHYSKKMWWVFLWFFDFRCIPGGSIEVFSTNKATKFNIEITMFVQAVG